MDFGQYSNFLQYMGIFYITKIIGNALNANKIVK